MGEPKVVPHKGRTLGGAEAEADLARLHRRFRSVSRRRERVLFFRRLYRAGRWWIACGLSVTALLWALTAYTRWPLPLALKHVAAAMSCDIANSLGVAPAADGKPGYWQRHDRDGDGVSCE